METVNEYQLQLRRLQTDFPRVKITGSAQAANFIKLFYSDDIEIFESMFILLLNQSNHTIGYAKISQGGVSGTVCDIKMVAKYAVDVLACGVILAHNHPSGNLRPSKADELVTKKVATSLRFLDITLHDHLIVTRDSYYSFGDHDSSCRFLEPHEITA